MNTLLTFTYGFRLLVRGNNQFSQPRIFCTIQGRASPCESSNISGKFASLLDNCLDAFSLRKVHACVFVYGFGNSNFLGSKLLNCYAKFGMLAESRWVFNRIINSNLSLWNSILVGYFRAGHYDEVLSRYLNLKEMGIGLDGSSVTFGLKSCNELGLLEYGRGMHVDAFKFDLNADCFVGSSLIGFYSKHGKIEDASRVFDEITNKDLVAYTSMITGYARCRDYCAYEAFRVVDSMQKQQLHPNRVTLVSLLQAAAQLEAIKEGREIHGYSIRKGIGRSDEIFETSLVDMYHKCGDPKMAACIFGKMDARTVCSWNTMIAGHLHMGQPSEAFYIFWQMIHENFVPDMVTLANAIFCCAELKYLHEGKSIHGYIVRIGAQLDLVCTTALVDLYSKFNIVLAGRMLDSSGNRDAVLYNVMVAGYLHREFSWEALKAFIEMVATGIKPNIGSILNILSAVSNMKDIRRGRGIHAHVLRHGFIGNVEIENQIINTYAKCGCILYAREVFNRMTYRDLISWTTMMIGYVHNGHADETICLFRLMRRETLDLDSIVLVSIINSLITTYAKCGRVDLARYLFEHMTERCLTSWNAIIAAYAMHGNCVEVLNLFDEMKTEKFGPDEVTFTSILTACSHSGMVEEGLQLFRTMVKEYSMLPCEVHYSCMVDLLSRAGRLEEAYDLVKCMPSTQSSSALPALLSACRVYGDTEMGEIIGRKILELAPERSTSYALVSNLYAEGGKWDEVTRIRAMTKEKGTKCTPGCSLIELQACEM
ncbi:Pentatricopeptide repeat-containing protein [Quillaja saponaria]|uniref:Pentatricopeptide repeat-containing protein n=1 Tax=Quillaja saponaria TaxID=32244 RepID=A0AAD7VG48_QUISA|nr:Pentatricopeptide repeat-containing protein [Quillaja saponaria]